MKLDTAEKRRNLETMKALVISALGMIHSANLATISDDDLELIEEDLANATLIARTVLNDRALASNPNGPW